MIEKLNNFRDSLINFWDNVRHHADMWVESLKADKEQEKSRVEMENKDFLPAALEILETPPSPLGRTLLWVILAFFVLTIFWMIIGRIDVVATGMGRIIPREQVKMIQAPEVGVVRAIYAQNGMVVKKGDVLIELDPTFADADKDQAQQALMSAEIVREQAEILREYITTGKRRPYNKPKGAMDTDVLTQNRLIESRIAEYEAAYNSVSEKMLESKSDLRAIKQEILKLRETLPLVAEQLSAREELLEKGLTPRFLVLELKERYVNHQNDLKIMEERLVKGQSAIKVLESQHNLMREEFSKTVNAEIAEAVTKIRMTQAELDKAERRFGLQKLRAPVDGTVQQLVVHTVGGVIQPIEPLMVVVPEDADLIAEARILNKDIGFVHEGDKVKVKLEAFPFTKYGIIEGVLENLSLDAVPDENLGLVYIARIRLEKNKIKVEEKTVKLSPGMVLTAEIMIGKRRIIEFITSPLLRYRDEAFRER